MRETDKVIVNEIDDVTIEVINEDSGAPAIGFEEDDFIIKNEDGVKIPLKVKCNGDGTYLPAFGALFKAIDELEGKGYESAGQCAINTGSKDK